MAISAGQILSPVKVWSASLTLDGEAIELAEGLPRRSTGFSQKRGICTLQTRTLPGAAAGAEAVVTLTLNGESTTFFTGRLGARPISDLPLSYEIGLVDSLARLDEPLVNDLVWNGRSFVGAVGDLLDAAGIQPNEIAGVFDPGGDYALGPVVAITIAKGTSISSALDTLLKFGGCGLFVLPNGQIEVADTPGWPAAPDGTTPVYAFGADIDEYGFYHANRTMIGQESVVAAYTAKGPRLPNKTIPDATFTLSGVTGSTVVEQFSYCQSEACAKAIAEREIVRRNRAATEVDVNAPLNPNLRPGDVILFRHPELGYLTNTPAIIIGISTSDDTMTMAISVGAKPADGDFSLIPPPNPDFTMRYETQPVSLAGIMAISTVVECQDASSDPSGFEITSRSWTASCAGDRQPEPASSTELNPIFIFPTLEGATITLSVESSSGEGRDTTKAVAPAAAEQFTRSLSVAAGSDGWRVLAGPTGWRSYKPSGGDCTAVPNINDQGPLLGGFSNGDLYHTADRLLTVPDLLFTFPSGVNTIFVNEGNPQEVLVGAGSLLARSSDGGVSWTPLFSFESDVQYAESSPANPSEIRVCAGSNLYISFDGVNVDVLLSGANGTVCRTVASAPWGHLAIFAGAEQLSDAWQFEEGHAIDWSGVPVEHLPIDLSAATATQYEEGYIVATGDAAALVRDGLYGQLTYLANSGPATALYKISAAGAGQFVASYISTTSAGGPHKLVNHHAAFPIDEVAQAYRIGYGTAVNPVVPPELVVLPYQQSGASDQLCHYLPELGWQLRALPQANAAWIGIDINPRNGSEWLIWTDENLYWTGNAGQSWVQVFTPPWDTYSIRIHRIVGVAFTGKGATWAYGLVSSDGYNNRGSSLVVGEQGLPLAGRIAGTCDWPYWKRTTADPMRHVGTFVRGYDGELWAYGSAEYTGGGGPGIGVGDDRELWVDTGSLSIAEVGETAYLPQAARDPANGRSGLAAWSNNVGLTANYRASVPSPTIAAGGSVAVCALGIFAGNRAGIAQILTIDTTPALQVVAGGTTNVGRIVAGSLRVSVAAPAAEANLDGTWTIFAHNGVQWAATQSPAMTAICAQIGVVDR
ncbi:hypothetical protein K2Z83_11295 [Oscillochloris sp. ZM17-4]|uniref:hypothetical protein n=1 Tax=Oscillochloris sp. ZM17-4 TaxID=2866714 RepID=UPI001C72FEBB|nr:hypothetical protein [Oscillochloris sp. ZM17-4]MBX0328261.1 hypothetical protein [Oscillochloris sp. ZM17-4]